MQIIEMIHALGGLAGVVLIMCVCFRVKKALKTHK